MPLHRLAIVEPLVAKQRPPFLKEMIVLAPRPEQQVPVVVPELMAKMADQRAIRLAQRGPHFFAMRVVRLLEIDHDDSAVVTR